MKRFTSRLLLFLALQFAIGAVLWVRGREEPVGYCASTLDKHQRLDSIPSPRCLLVGGSSLAFGVDSEMIERRLGLPTVNLAISAGNGLDFILSEAADAARRGDVILLSLEYEHFVSDMTLVDHVQQTVTARPRSAEYLSAGQVKQLLDRGLIALHMIARQGWKGKPAAAHFAVYSRSSFNDRGDVVAHHELPSTYDLHRVYGELQDDSFDEQVVSAALEKVNRFVELCHSRGAQVLFAHPPVASDYYQAKRQTIDAIDGALQSELSAPIIDELSRAVFEPNMFFDTAYHLTRQGKLLRTELLAESAELKMRGDKTLARSTFTRPP